VSNPKPKIYNVLMRIQGDVSAEVVEIDILEGMLKNLSIQEKATASLDGFDVLSSRNKGLVLSFTATERGAKLISTLLFLAESPDHIVAQRAENIIKIIEFRNLEAPDSENHSRSILNTIRSGLLEANSTSLSLVLCLSWNWSHADSE
jgi:hypothetical protein